VKRTAEIVGCGLAGLVTGLALAQKGWRVRIHERESSLRTSGEGIFVWESGLRVLNALGVLFPANDDGIRIVRHERRNHRGEKISSSSFGENFRLCALLREDLLTALEDAFLETGGTILFNSRAVVADLDGSVHFADGRSLRSDLVVAADGRDSSIRDSLRLLKWRLSTNQVGYGAVVPEAVATASQGTYREYWNGPRRLLHAPCASGFAWVQLIAPASDTPGAAVGLDHEFWHSLFPTLTPILDRIPVGTRADRFEIIRLEAWSEGKVAVVGNAANAQPPFLSHGVGCTMMSAFSLAQAVDRADNVVDGLAAWELRERAFNEWTQWVAYWYGQLAFLPAGPRIVTLKAIDASTWVRRRTLLAAACRDVTAIVRPSPADEIAAGVYPMIH
jgi:2-polyprenyl-6-methoxyphenol hydroxylase-like FAD-dependent oxidoreductase